MKLILLIGLPGSGKTIYGKSLGFPFLDDLAQNGGWDALRQVDPTTETLVISDSRLIRYNAVKAFLNVVSGILPITEVECVVWENDPLACYANIVRRNDGRIISKPALLQMSKQYVYSEGAIPRPVYQGE